MQLGELQHQIQRFERRDVQILALSVDPPSDSLSMVRRLGLTFELASDSDQAAIQAFGVQNPDTNELALHAVYIVDSEGEVFYRKVASRRPLSAELIDAIDARSGTYPQNDPAEPRARIDVAYPQNNFQALLEISQVSALPESVSRAGFERTIEIIRTGSSDDAVFAYRDMLAESPEASLQDLLDAAAFLTRSLLLEGNADAIATGDLLRKRLARIRELEERYNVEQTQAIADQLARARAGLTLTHSKINENAASWRLRSVKTTLRVHRELSSAARVDAAKES